MGEEMNGDIKWHKANGPAFAPGEQWRSVSGNIRCEIVSVSKFGPDKWDYLVTYKYPDGGGHTKDAWNFQVRYQHIADNNLKITGPK